MPTQEGDILKITQITELSGIQASNTYYMRVVSLGTGGADDQKFLADWYAVFVNFVASFTSNKVLFSCAVIDNQSRSVPKRVGFGTLTGNVADDAHPQDQVLRFNEYAQNQPQAIPKRGAINIMGVAEQFSTRGRLNAVNVFQNFRLFLSNPRVYDTGIGYTVQPVLRWRTNPGASPPTYDYWDMVVAVINPVFYKLRSRRQRLCGAV